MKSNRPGKRFIRVHLNGDWFMNLSLGFFAIVAGLMFILDVFLWGVFL